MRVSRPVPIAIGLSLVLLTGVADATSTTCTTSAVCAEYINSSSGVAIHGEANTGIGIRGTSNGSTGFYGASRSGSMLFPGVEGESLNQTGQDAAGAFGLSGATGGTAPAYGVVAYGSFAGAFAETTGNAVQSDPGQVTSFGVEGFDGGGSANDDANVGVSGTSEHGTGIAGFANDTIDESGFLSTFPIGVIGDAEGEHVHPLGAQAIGVLGVSQSFPMFAYNISSGIKVTIASQGSTINSNSGFSVDSSANMNAASLTTNKGVYVRTTGTSGTTRMSYSARTTAPVMEDFGEAQLVNGRGYVRLDPALSDVIDNRTAYHVFLTPEGESNELYVTQKTPAGFMVREAHGGRSTLSFDYRILAKPVDDDAKRLALAPPLPKMPTLHHDLRPAHAAAQPAIDPLARLASHLGPAEYARQLKAAKANETVP